MQDGCVHRNDNQTNQETGMSLVPDEYVFAPMTVAEVSPIVHARLPGASIESDCFDAFVTCAHGPDERIGRDVAYEIARRLRGGRDVDRTMPSDWHVRSLTPDLYLTDTGRHPRERERIGTRIWFSRTYAVPPDYDERGGDDGDMAPPGRRAA
jgi:hypothetical protein